MKLGIMQPYFFPYLGYFALIKHTDKWVVFDTVQYINKGWVNRNRILSQSKEGIKYITVPVQKQSRGTIIKDIFVDNSKDWKEKILGQLEFYKKKAPFYNQTRDIVEEVINIDVEKISELNVYGLKCVCNYLNIKFDYQIFSENIMGIEGVNAPDEWALEISKKMNAATYINSPGGKSFFDKNKYTSAGIDLQFMSLNLEEYDTFNSDFTAGLSIIDVMMFNAPENINKMLDNYTLL